MVRENNRIALEAMMRGQKADAADSALPEVWTLERVADMLRIGPPVLTELMACCMDFKKIREFLGLIREYLPEHEADILAQPRQDRLHRFAYLFGKRYFPIASQRGDNLEAFVSNLPVMLAALSHSSYHDLQMRPGYLLLLSLVIYPYEGSEADVQDMEERDYEAEHDFVPSPSGFGQLAPVKANKKDVKRRKERLAEILNGPRVPLLDLVQNLVGRELAGRVPAEGWAPQWLHQATDGTKYDGVGQFADWACSNTGCVVLDTSYADCHYIEGDGEPYFKWTRYNVDMLASEWPRVQKIRAAIDRMVEWLEGDMERRFGELLVFLRAQKQPRTKKRRGYDELDHECPLEQPSEEDECYEQDEQEEAIAGV